MLEDVLRQRSYVGLLCPHQKNFVQMKTLFPPPDPGLSMHSYKIVIYRCKCGAHSPRGTKRIQLMVCVPIVPVRYDSEDPVRPNGQPCEIWRNVHDTTEQPVEHVAALNQVASLSSAWNLDHSGSSAWNLDGSGTLSAEAKFFITSNCKLCPDMNWGEMRTKLDSHFKQRVSLGPSGYMNAAQGFFKRTKKAVTLSSSADLLQGRSLDMNDTFNFRSQHRETQC